MSLRPKQVLRVLRNTYLPRSYSPESAALRTTIASAMLAYRKHLAGFLFSDAKLIRRLLIPVRQVLITEGRAFFWSSVTIEATKMGLLSGVFCSAYLIWKARRLGWIPSTVFIKSQHSIWFGIGLAVAGLLLSAMPFVLMAIFIPRRKKPTVLAAIPLLWPGAAVLLSAAMIYRIEQGFLLGSRDTFTYLVLLVFVVTTQAGAFVTIFLYVSINVWSNSRNARVTPDGLVMRGLIQLLILISNDGRCIFARHTTQGSRYASIRNCSSWF